MSAQFAHVIRISILLLLSEMVQSQMLDDLSSLRWQNRIVMLNNIEHQDAVLRSIENQQDEIKDRDIIWFMLSGHAVQSNYVGDLAEDFAALLRDQYQLSAGQVILIGKDGGLKSSFDGINLNAIFSDIDAMPMRQREMQQ